MIEVLIVAASAILGAAGQEAASPAPATSAAVKAVQACRAVAVPADRLACFDGAARVLEDAIARREVVVVDQQEVRRARKSLFGFELPSLAMFNGGGNTEPPFVAIDSTVVRSAAAGYGKYDITIEGGAVWRNIELLDDPPTAGEKVHINKTMMGGYFLRASFNRPVRAQRVR